MTTVLGANLQELQSLAQQFSQSADQLRVIRATLAQRVIDNQGWRGPDADRFKGQWGNSDTTLAVVAGSLETASTRLVDDAREQEQASDQGNGSSDGSAGRPGPGTPIVPGGGGTANGDGWLDDVFAAGAVGAGLFSKGKDAFQLLRNSENFLSTKRIVDISNGLRNAGWADDLANAGRFSQVTRFLGPALAPLAIAGGIHDIIDPAHSGAIGLGDRLAGGLSVIGGGGTLLMAAGLLNPVGAGIVVGAGLAAGAWAAGTYIYDNWDDISEFTGNAVDAVGDFAADSYDSVRDTVTDTVGDVAEGLGDVADGVGDFMDDPIGSLGGLFS
ncbi:hypothetical protein GM708_17820 [Vibrio cholerae]|nr:hypothetical protein [Vibrio cholerae]